MAYDLPFSLLARSVEGEICKMSVITSISSTVHFAKVRYW